MKKSLSEVVIIPTTVADSLVQDLGNVMSIIEAKAAVDELVVVNILNYPYREDVHVPDSWDEVLSRSPAAAHKETCTHIQTSIWHVLNPFIDRILDAADKLSYQGKPEISMALVGNSYRVTVKAVKPETDYDGVLQDMVDKARERGEFIPYKILQALGQID